MITVALMVLASLPWDKIFDALFKFLQKKYGEPVMDLAFTNVGTLEEHKKLKLIDSDQAEALNVKMIQTATAQSPGISKTMAKFVNLVTYGKWKSVYDPEGFKEWIDRSIGWQKKAPSVTAVDFSLMGLYVNPPDRRKSR